MPIPQEISDILSEFGVPAGAIALAVGLVRGANALEKDANPEALRYVATVLKSGSLSFLGKAGATVVPVVFDRVFGDRVASLKFITRSILATTTFWLILLILKHARWERVTSNIMEYWNIYLVLIPIWYILDWVSLAKARILMGLISQRNALTSTVLFVTLDITASYLLTPAFLSLFFLITFGISMLDSDIGLGDYVQMLRDTVDGFVRFSPVLEAYIKAESDQMGLGNVIVPSTLLTSIWTILILVSGIISQLLLPVDYVRRFATWWFRDVERQPLTVIAKVAATLIILGAMVIKAVRWIY